MTLASSLAKTPSPPYYAVIFTSQRTKGDRGYGYMADRMVTLASRMPRFLGVESVRGADGLGITVSYCESEDSIREWKAHSEHQVAQETGKRVWYADYVIRVGTGQLAARLAEDGFDVTAIDSNKEVITATSPLGVDARLAKWPEFNDGQFDAVLFTRSLHHIHPLQESLQHALECLSDCGRIIVEDFAYEVADVRSLHWFTTIARKFAASGFLREKSGLVGEALANGLTLESWNSNHDPDLNSAAAIAEELKVVFGNCVIENAAYYFRYLAAAMGPLEKRDSIIAALTVDESRLISKGAIAALGRRFVAKRFLG